METEVEKKLENQDQEISKEKNEPKEPETLEKEISTEPTMEQKYQELETKYNALVKEKTDRERSDRHEISYQKYDLTDENKNLLKRYLSDKDNIDDELEVLNKDFPHLFNPKKDTSISKSLELKDFKNDEKETQNEVDNRKLGMVG